MRPRNCMHMLTAVAATTALTAAPAEAKYDGGHSPYPTPRAFVQHTNGSPDWALVGLAAGGGATLLVTGLASSRKRSRRDGSAAQVRIAGGS